MYRERDAEAGLSGAAMQAAGARLTPTHPAQPPIGEPAAGAQAPPRLPAAADAPAAKRSLRLGRRALLGAAVVLALGTGATYGYRWWTVGRFIESTDDAYVSAHNTTLAAKVAGYVSSIAVEDNTAVRAGDVIAAIDDGDYRLAVEQARDKLATQQATVARIGRQVVAQEALVEQAKAQLASAQAAFARAKLEYDRQQTLAQRDFASRQTLEQAQSNRDQAAAGVDSARASRDSAAANVEVLNAQQQEAERTAQELRTTLAKAERDLSFTVIRAPVDGVIGNRAAQTGDFVQPGQRLASLVPLDEIYVDANFKETQLAHLKPGQKVTVSVDALPDRAIDGTVMSLSPASGSVFSLLPPDNATGNFTKIVQRLPVRIGVPVDVAAQGRLRPGMSVVVSVDTRSSAQPSVAQAAASQSR